MAETAAPAIRNVALAGASGTVGAVILDKLVASGAFAVTLLRRPGSALAPPPGVRVVDVAFDAPEALAAALAGHDAVVSALGSAALGLQQQQLIDAAVAAGVRRFLPSEFGCDLDDARTRTLPVFAEKVRTADYLAARARDSGLSYTLVSSGVFLDQAIKLGLCIDASAPDATTKVWGDGSAVFSSTTMASVGDAVVGVLAHPAETRNRRVYVEDVKTSQRALLALGRRAAPDWAWATRELSIDAATAQADARLAAGKLDLETFMPYLVRAIFDPAYGASFARNDNALLGVAGKTDADLVAMIQDATAAARRGAGA